MVGSSWRTVLAHARWRRRFVTLQRRRRDAAENSRKVVSRRGARLTLMMSSCPGRAYPDGERQRDRLPRHCSGCFETAHSYLPDFLFFFDFFLRHQGITVAHLTYQRSIESNKAGPGMTIGPDKNRRQGSAQGSGPTFDSSLTSMRLDTRFRIGASLDGSAIGHTPDLQAC